jgi:hypothetical protein
MMNRSYWFIADLCVSSLYGESQLLAAFRRLIFVLRLSAPWPIALQGLQRHPKNQESMCNVVAGADLGMFDVHARICPSCIS